MKAYKGFNRDMTCRGFQYKKGGEYETEKASVCENWTDEMRTRYGRWLFAPATERKGEGDGK
jgi:hypothetical protein